jgi:WD40 repeat protein
MAFSNDGDRISCPSMGKKDRNGKQTWVMEDYDTATGQKVGTRPFYWGIPSPDGTLEANFVAWPFPTNASEEGMLYLKGTTVAPPRPLVRWRGHEAHGATVAFSPDGKILATLDNDGVVKLWNLPWIRQEMAAMGLGW